MASTWYRSRGFRIAAIVVGLLLVVLLLAPYVLSIDRYRPAIVEQLKKETGRDVEIEKIRLHFLPSLHVQVVNFRVRNPRGFPPGDTAAIESVDVGLAFWPLLRRQVEIGSVGVRNVEVNLLTDERGRTNYAMPRKRKTRAKKAAEGPVVSITQIGSVALEGVKVSSGTFWSRQKRVYPNWTATGINVGVRNLDLSDPKWLRKAEADLDLSTIEISVPALKEPLHFTDGEVEVKENTANGDFTLALGSLRANGTVKVANLERPVADFALAMKELNVAEIGAAAAQKPKGGSGPRGSSGAGSRQLLARGTVKVGRVRVPPYSAQNVQGKVRLYGNRLEVDPFTLAVYGGKTRGTLTVNLDQASMPAQVSLKAEGVNVAQAMAAASPKAKDTITGTFEADGRLGLPLGAGDPLAGLSGQGNFAVRNGTFPGLNVEGTLAKMGKFMQMDIPSGDTNFSYFGGDYRISDQRVHSRNLRLEAETLEASMKGSFGFDQTLNYSGSGLLTGKGGEQQEQSSKNPLSGLRRVFGGVMRQTFGRMRVPFVVRGTFQDPNFVLAGPPQPIP